MLQDKHTYTLCIQHTTLLASGMRLSSNIPRKMFRNQLFGIIIVPYICVQQIYSENIFTSKVMEAAHCMLIQCLTLNRCHKERIVFQTDNEPYIWTIRSKKKAHRITYFIIKFLIKRDSTVCLKFTHVLMRVRAFVFGTERIGANVRAIFVRSCTSIAR